MSLSTSRRRRGTALARAGHHGRLPVPLGDVALHADAEEGRVGDLEEPRDGVGDAVLRVSSAIVSSISWCSEPPAFWRVMTMSLV